MRGVPLRLPRQCFQAVPGRYVVLSVTLALPEPVAARHRLCGRGERTESASHRGARSARRLRRRRAIRRRKLPDPAVIAMPAASSRICRVAPERNELIAHHPSLVSYDIGGGRYKLAAGWLIDACGLKGMPAAGLPYTTGKRWCW